MKNYFILFAFISFLSCSKDSNNEEPAPTGPYIKYTAGSSQFEFKGTYNNVITGKPGVYIARFPKNAGLGAASRYALTGQQDPSTGIKFEIEVDSLIAASYNCYEKLTSGGAPRVAFNGKAYSTFATDGSQKLSVQISRYSNGTVDGTFQGTLYSYDATPIPVDITKGEFKNVEVIFFP